VHAGDDAGTGRHANDHQHDHVRQKGSHHLSIAGPQGQPHADFATPLANGVADQAGRSG